MGEKVYKPIVKDGNHLLRSKDNPDRVRGLTRDENNQNPDIIELDFAVEEQKAIHDRVVAASREIYEINDALSGRPAKRIANLLQRQKETLISEIQGLIDRVYRLDY